MLNREKKKKKKTPEEKFKKNGWEPFLVIPQKDGEWK